MSKSEIIPQVSKIPERLKKLKTEATQKENELLDVVMSIYDSFKETQHEVGEKISQAPHAINKMAHEKPWMYVGGAAAIGLLVGFILGRK